MVNRTRYRNELGQIDAVDVFFPTSWLVSYYKLNETTGTSVADSFGSNTGTATNVTWTAGKISNAGSFATSSYINMWNVLNFEYNQAWSRSFWIKSTESWAAKHILSKQNNASPNQWTWTEWDSGKIRTYIYSGSANSIIITTNATYNDWTWKYITVTYDWSNTVSWLKHYVNWAIVATTSQGQSYCGATVLTTQWFQINGRWNSTNSTSASDIDEVWIWNRALTQDEITVLYNLWNGRTLA